MTTPTPLTIQQAPGPLVAQPPAAASLAEILCHAAEDLWEAATLDNPADMYEDARRAASRVLAACPID